jgi:hypothetical protein
VEKAYKKIEFWEDLGEEDRETVWTRMKVIRKEFRISIVISSSDEIMESLTRRKYSLLKLKELLTT